ncbi:hypothetical protein WA158_006437 [Blastocystis sp. Blastoise]
MFNTRIILLFVAFNLLCCLAEDSYYDVLGIEKNAEEKSIKKAYRRLSIKYHPDKCKTEECKVQFAAVQEAYDCLIDDNLRRVYDQKGKQGVEDYKKQEQQGGAPSPFASFFGGQPQKQRNQDKLVKVKVSLEDLYNGRDLEMKIPRKELCSHCHGTGAETPDDFETCPYCHGQGFTIEKHEFMPGFVQQVQQQCSHCHGKGSIIKKQCHVCHGKHLVDGHYDLSLTVEKGMSDGEEITFENKGDQHPDMDAGHIIVHLEQQPHRLFTRDQDNLRITLTITLKEALLGWSKTITHLDGHKVTFGNQDITKPGQVLTINEEGMPKHNFPSEKGDLLVTVKVKFPKTLTNEQKEQLKSILG